MTNHPPHPRVRFLVTCEHGGNRIPLPYRDLFTGYEALLRTHRGYDTGALRVARELAAALDAPLIASVTSRLLIDLNRSRGHPRLYSEATRGSATGRRHAIFEQHYLPYRAAVETQVMQAIDEGALVIHVSCHSFTPELDGKLRNTDIGLLYDPARQAEADLCRRWREAIRTRHAGLKVRMNYPYTGTADGLTTALRRRFPAQCYLGVELELNQKHVSEGGGHWRSVRGAIIEAFTKIEWRALGAA